MYSKQIKKIITKHKKKYNNTCTNTPETIVETGDPVKDPKVHAYVDQTLHMTHNPSGTFVPPLAYHSTLSTAALNPGHRLGTFEWCKLCIIVG